MAQDDIFVFGDAEVFMDRDRSVHRYDPRRSLTPRSVTLFISKPGEFFRIGKLGVAQKLVKQAAENVYGVTTGVVNMRSITLYDQTIKLYEDGLEVATDFTVAYNEIFSQRMAVIEKALENIQSP
jgi:hypothetical protein